jgi:hypothetical protein
MSISEKKKDKLVTGAIRQLARSLAKREGKKHQASFGDIEEILGHLSDLHRADPSIGYILWVNGVRRARKTARK